MKIFIGVMILATAAAQNWSQINGVTYLDGVNLGPGTHRVQTVTENGKVYYMITTTNDAGNVQNWQMPAKNLPPGTNFHMTATASGTQTASQFNNIGPSSSSRDPPLMFMQMPEINEPIIFMPPMPKMRFPKMPEFPRMNFDNMFPNVWPFV